MGKKMWITLVLCICMFAVPSVGARAAESDVIANDESGIPDKALYKGILKALGKKTNETFTKQEAEKLTELETGGVSSLQGIGYLSQLEQLRIEGWKLRSLEGVDELHKLVDLDVSYNKLKSLKSLGNLTSLEYLTVDLNQLTSLEGIENLKNLKGLYASWNKITNLKPLKGLTNLEYVWITNNNLKSLKGIENSKNLRSLLILANNLTNVNELKGLTNLEELNISYNKIKKLPNMKNFGKLRYASCDIHDNRLTKKEIQKKLPERFFKKGKAKKEWLDVQADYQNLNYKVTLIEPQNAKKISKSTKRIVGRTMKDVYVELYCSSKEGNFERVKADKNGKFVLDGLNLKEFGGRTVGFKITMRGKSGKIRSRVLETELKVKK